MPNQAPKVVLGLYVPEGSPVLLDISIVLYVDGFTAFSGSNTQDLRCSLTVTLIQSNAKPDRLLALSTGTATDINGQRAILVLQAAGGLHIGLLHYNEMKRQ